MEEKIKLGISTCLLGEKVRYDGGHKLDAYLKDTLGEYVQYVPVCPEYECGLGVPREALRLVGDIDSPRLVTNQTGVDLTDRMTSWATKRIGELALEDLCGFIFKSKSPSSGMERVKVYNDKGMAEKKGVGLFARMFMQAFPLLPVEEEGRLHDPILRENFITRIFALKRWRKTISAESLRPAIVEFHATHKLLLMAHSEKHAREMGRLVSNLKATKHDTIKEEYERNLLQALSFKASISKNINVLQHIMGYFKKILTPEEKQELLEIFELYRNRLMPLIVPITLLNHYVRKYDEPYLKGQYYLHPHPIELQLRNHV